VKLSALLTVVCLIAACSKNIQTNEAVRQSVIEYLSAKAPQTGLDMNSMTVEVSTVSFERDEARATISIKPKNSDGAAMQLPYTLDRKGDKWVVRGLVASGGNPHGSVAPGAEPGTQALPQGHPPVGNKE
jgi:hypothetical protein